MESIAYKLGTHRTRLPADTLRRVQPFLKQMGITRVANVTGLDRVGIPVYTAFRPNSKSISVSQGKGSECLAAKASAVMESVEAYHAEHIDHPLHFASVSQLSQHLNVADLSQLARTTANVLDVDTPIFWIESHNYADDRSVWIPFELVSADYAAVSMRGYGHFAANTNGLASGNSKLEAICHGLCEVVERDCESLWRQLSHKAQALTGVDLDSIDDENCLAVLAQFKDANIEVRVWQTNSDIALPCYICLALGDELDWADPEFGSGCHPAKEVALARALTEAAQARATFIAGSRDDIGLSEYQPRNRSKRRQLGLAQMQRFTPNVRFDATVSYSAAHMQGDLEHCLAQLSAAGFAEVYVVDLSKSDFGIAVAKVVIPGLEGAQGHGSYVPGARARKLTSHPLAQPQS